MLIKQMKEWLNNLPVEFDNFPVAIMQNISLIENSQNGSVIIKDRLVTLCIINDQIKKAFVLDNETAEKFNKHIRKDNEIE